MTHRIVKEVMMGNGSQYTVKEILQAHVQDGKKFEDFVRGEFRKGQTLMIVNKTRINSIVNALKYVVGPTLFLIIGALVTYAFNVIP